MRRRRYAHPAMDDACLNGATGSNAFESRHETETGGRSLDAGQQISLPLYRCGFVTQSLTVTQPREPIVASSLSKVKLRLYAYQNTRNAFSILTRFVAIAERLLPQGACQRG